MYQGHVVGDHTSADAGGDDVDAGDDPVSDALDIAFLVMSRTMHGGDTHAKTAQVFGNQDLILITPNADTAATIDIDVGPGGTLVVTSLNACVRSPSLLLFAQCVWFDQSVPSLCAGFSFLSRGCRVA